MNNSLEKLAVPRPVFKSHAYLVVRLKPNGTPFPTFNGFGIYSEPGESLTACFELFATVMSMSGDSYADAQLQLLTVLKSTPSMWAMYGPWLNPSREAHMARLEVWDTLTSINAPVETASRICKAFEKLSVEN